MLEIGTRLSIQGDTRALGGMLCVVVVVVAECVCA